VIRLLAALLIGATWPFSFPMALLVAVLTLRRGRQKRVAQRIRLLYKKQ
jgi:hypothetical protein